VTGIKEAGNTEIQPPLCRVAVMTALAVQIVSCYWHTTREARQLPLSHICFTHYLHYQIPVWVFWREFCSC